MKRVFRSFQKLPFFANEDVAGFGLSNATALVDRVQEKLCSLVQKNEQTNLESSWNGSMPSAAEVLRLKKFIARYGNREQLERMERKTPRHKCQYGRFRIFLKSLSAKDAENPLLV